MRNLRHLVCICVFGFVLFLFGQCPEGFGQAPRNSEPGANQPAAKAPNASGDESSNPDPTNANKKKRENSPPALQFFLAGLSTLLVLVLVCRPSRRIS